MVVKSKEVARDAVQGRRPQGLKRLDKAVGTPAGTRAARLRRKELVRIGEHPPILSLHIHRLTEFAAGIATTSTVTPTGTNVPTSGCGGAGPTPTGTAGGLDAPSGTPPAQPSGTGDLQAAPTGEE